MINIYSLDNTLLGSIREARARVLLKNKEVRIKSHNPYELYMIKPLKEFKRVRMNFISIDGGNPRNLDQICRVELNKKSNTIMFYYTTFSARLSEGGDIKYEKLQDAQKMFDSIVKVAQSKNYISNGEELVNLDNVCNISLNEKDATILFFMVAETARTNWKYSNSQEAKEEYNKLIVDKLKSTRL